MIRCNFARWRVHNSGMRNFQMLKTVLALGAMVALWGCGGMLRAQTTILDDPLLRDAGARHYNRPWDVDSLIATLETELEDSSLDPESRHAIVATTALAYALSIQGQYTRSASIFLKVLPLFERSHDLPAQGFTHYWLSFNYKMRLQYDVAEGYARKSVALYRQADREAGVSDALNSLGNALHKQEKQDSAIHYYQQSGQVALEVGYAYGVARSYNNVGNIHLLRHESEEALENYRKALAITQEHSLESPSFYINNIGGAYLQMGKPDTALLYVQLALDSMGPQPEHGLRINVYSNLALACAALGDFERAYHAKDTLLKLNQTVFQERQYAQLAEKEAIYETEAKQQRIALLEADNALKALEIARSIDRRNILVAMVITLVVLAGLGWLAYRNKRQSNKLLHEQKKRIELMNALLEEKVLERTEALSRVNAELDQLLYRSSHDLRTPITKLKGLMSLLENEQDPAESLKLMDLVSLSVRNLDSLNLSVCEAGNIRIHTPKRVSIALPTLVAEIREQMGDHKQECVFLPPTGCNLHADKWLLRLALHELLQNALDAQQGKPSKVTFLCEQEKSGSTLRISDDGPGVPPDLQTKLFELFSRGNNHPSRHGLGLYKARLAIEKMGGRLDLEVGSPKGAVFLIRLPAPAFS